MPIDREDTLKRAEKLVRQGKLDAAIAEYLRVVDDQPRDWASANTLGDLYVRAGQPDQAAAQYARIAHHFMVEGFFPKASALFKKLLRLTPDDEASQLNLADISQKQGLLADAKARLNAVAAKRRARGDQDGTAEIVVLLGSLDPGDFEARNAAARTLAGMGRAQEAAGRFRAVYEDLLEKDRPAALDALRRAVELNPLDQEGRAALARVAVDAGDFDAARRYLDRETAGADPALQLALVEIELRAGRFDGARALLPALLARGRDERQPLIELAWTLVGSSPDAAWTIVEAAADSAVAGSEFGDAVAMLQEFAARVPRQIQALTKLVEVCVGGGLESAMYEAQAELADAYLATGQATEARGIAEDLVAREPWERAHLERFRRALVMLKVSDPDSVIAERLSGRQPFTVQDRFATQNPASIEVDAAQTSEVPTPEAMPDSPEAAPPEPEAEPEPEPEPEADQTEWAALPSDFGGSTSSGASEDDGAGSEAFAAVFGPAGAEPAGEPDADSAADHMALARTYLEMSMPDEAVEPLKEAFQSPLLRFEAASTLGRLYQQRGDVAEAIDWLERAAATPAATRDEGHAVLYDLGALIEQGGDTSRALAVFLELAADAGPYRDVAERIERLARVETGG